MILIFLKFGFKFDFKKTKIKILNLSLKSAKGMKPYLFIIKKWMKFGIFLVNAVYYFAILLLTVK
jgi:hypothetical protein